MLGLLSIMMATTAMAKNNDNLVITCSGDEEAEGTVEGAYGTPREGFARLIIEKIVINKEKIQLTYKFTATYQALDGKYELGKSVTRNYITTEFLKPNGTDMSGKAEVFTVRGEEISENNSEGPGRISMNRYGNYSNVFWKKAYGSPLVLQFDGLYLQGIVSCKQK